MESVKNENLDVRAKKKCQGTKIAQKSYVRYHLLQLPRYLHYLYTDLFIFMLDTLRNELDECGIPLLCFYL